MNKIHLYDKILFPVVTEKSTNLSEQNKIIFRVPKKANKKNLGAGRSRNKGIKLSQGSLIAFLLSFMKFYIRYFMN